MRLMEEKLGPDYPDTVSFTVKFATGLAQQGRMEEAIEIAERAEGLPVRPWGRATRSHRNMPGFCSP